MTNPSVDSELPAFGRFIETLNGRGESMTAEEAAKAFRRYQSQLIEFRLELQPALQELDAGLGHDLDVEGIIAKGKEALGSEGITD